VRPVAYRELAQLWAADEADEPVRLRARVRRIQAGRPLRIGLESLRLLAVDAGATIAHPLATPEFGLAVAAAAPSGGYDSRSAAVLALFGDLLPQTLVERSTKALFDTAFWGRHSRTLAASWNGEGVDPAVVETSALRAVWAQNEPDAHTFLMLQAAWLEHHRQFQNRTTRPTASGGMPTVAVRS
jgi:asparagine synthase (glutamine-hydrolysing)